MSLRFPDMLAALLLTATAAEARDIRVCADPENLPFSNQRGDGFENRILDLVAQEMGARIVYVWTAERRATAVEMMNKGRCDLVPGAIANAPGVATTGPYMHSAYAFVLRGERAVAGFDDPRLRSLRIGVQSVSDDAVTPPAAALIRRGLAANIRPFTLHGHASDPNSAGSIVEAVAHGDIDTAVLWGPFAGYFAAQEKAPMRVIPVKSGPADPQMDFAIAMATRTDDPALRDAVDRALTARRGDIARILDEDHVPQLAEPAP